MRVTVGIKADENSPGLLDLEGDCPLFGKRSVYDEYDHSLDSVGFWLSNWRMCTSASGRNNTLSRRFIPWSSVLFVDEINTGGKGEYEEIHTYAHRH